MKVHIAKRDCYNMEQFPKLHVNRIPLFNITLMRLFFQKMQFKEALVIEFCMMFNRVLYVKISLTLWTAKKKKRYWLWTPSLDLSLISLWVLTNSKIAVNCFHLFTGEGNLWGDTWSNIQPLDLWFWAYSHCFANRSWPRCMCQIVL